MNTAFERILNRNSLPTVTDEICDFYGVTLNQVLSVGRRQEVAEARQIIMYVMKHTQDITWKLLGEKFGKDHSTAIHAINQIKDLMDNTPALKSAVAAWIAKENLERQGYTFDKPKNRKTKTK